MSSILMSDFIIEDGVLTKYVGPGGDVVLPKQIRKIGMFAFQDCIGLESVVIPQQIESIGLQAFYARSTHPAILTYLDIKKPDFYKIESSVDGKTFVTARGWSDLSDMIRLCEENGSPVNAQLIGQ